MATVPTINTDSVISAAEGKPLPQPALSIQSIVDQTPVDEFAQFEDATPEEIQRNTPPDEFAQFEDAEVVDEFDQFEDAEAIDVETPEEFIKDPEFNIVQFLEANPEIANDPIRKSKLIEAYRLHRKRGITGKVVGKAIKAAPAVGLEFLKGSRDLMERAIDVGVQPAVNTVLGLFSDPQTRRELQKVTKANMKKAIGEVAAGSETAAFGMANLLRTGSRKLFTSEEDLDKATPEQLWAQLLDDVEFSKQAKQVAKGQGVVAETIGLDAEELRKEGIELDPEAIAAISTVDPLTLVGTGGAFSLVTKAGRVVATTKTAAQAANLAKRLGTTVQRVAPKVAGAAPKIVGKGIQVTGRGVERLGQKSSPVLKTAGGLAGAVKGFEFGGVAGGAAGAGLGAGGGAAIARGIEATGRGIQKLGNATYAFGRKVAGEIPKGRLFRAVNRVATSGPVVGATIGAAAAAPLGLAADTDEEAAQLIAGGIALGGGAGAGIGAAKKFAALRDRYVGNRLLEPFKRDTPPPIRESADYGLDPNMDAIHREQFTGLDPESKAVVNEFRELFRDEGEIYLQSPEAYAQRIAEIVELEKGAPLTAAELAAVQDYAKTRAVTVANFVTPDGPRKVVFLNKDAQGLPHDAGHLFEALLPEAERQALYAQVRARYSPQEIQAFKKRYEDALNIRREQGEPVRELSPEEIYSEIVAENFSALFSNVDVTTLGTPRPLADRLIQSAASLAERAGIDLGGGRVTPDLGARQSITLQAMIENAMRPRAEKFKATQEAAAPEATAPQVGFPEPQAAEAGGAVPGVRNKRVTPEEQAGTAAPAPDSAGIQTARAFAEESGNAVLASVVDDIAAAFERKRGEVTPLEFEVLGAKEAQPGKPTGRTARLEERLKADLAEAAGAAPEDVRNLFQAVQVPVRFEVVGRGKNQKLQLLGMSLDKVMANVGIIAREAGKRDLQSLIPYDIVQTGDKFSLTPEAWRRFQKDLVTYTENQQNGYRGDGRALTRPEESLGASIPTENPNYKPTVLPEEVGNFINLIQGIAPPRTARVTGKGVPGNIKARTIAELNLRNVETPARIANRDINKQTFPTGETIGEVNPLRNQLADNGVPIRDLHEVTERFRVDRIKSVKPRSELQFRAPQTDLVRAGFLPELGANLPPELQQRRVKAAAIRTPSGELIEGTSHIDAFLKATEEGKLRSDESFEDGFVDGAGNFLTREEAFQRATEIKQAEESALSTAQKLGGALESQEFAREAKFLPERQPRTGTEFTKFFTDVSAGRFGKSDKPFIPEVELPKHTGFIATKERHTGNFDNHIQKSIPTFYEAQIVKGKAIVDSLPEGGRVLDIAASEGSFGKAISEESGGRVETVSLDPNQQMKKFFEEKSQVEGATYDDRAFLNGFEEEGRTVPAFQTSQRFDVINETMGFQFIDGDRAPQIAEVKRLLDPEGVFFTEEKLKNADWAKNEKLKDSEFKNKYFDKEALKAKEKRVGFQQSKNEQNAVGMVDNMATQAAFEAVLLENFAHVVQYWDSGNFKGYIASDSKAAVNRYLKNLENIDSKFSTVETPRVVEEPAASFLPEAPADLVSEVSRMGATEFRRAFDGAEGGMTGVAVRAGKKFKSPEQIEILQTLEQAAKDEMRAALQEGNMDDAMILASKPQFFREMRESATETGSVGGLKVEDTLNRGQFLPARDAGTPRTERGKALAKRYSFTRHPKTNVEGERMITFSDPDKAEIIGEIIYGVPDADGVGSIKHISVDPDYRLQGIGQTLMREAMSDLQNLGATDVISDPAIVDARAVMTREAAAPGRTRFRPQDRTDLADITPEMAIKNLQSDNPSLMDARTDIRGARFLPETEALKKASKGLRVDRTVDAESGSVRIELTGDKPGLVAFVEFSLREKAINDLYVQPEQRRKGIGEALIREAFTELQKVTDEVSSEPGITNPAAVRLREKVAPNRNTFFDPGDDFTGLGARPAEEFATAQDAIDFIEASGIGTVGARTDIRGAQFLPRTKKAEKLPLPMKAFIAPDAQFIRVNRNTHDDYLIENSAKLNKKYKTKIPAKQGKEDVRIMALNKGFIRVAYEPNNGRLTYEANAKTFDKKQADKIFEHVADNLDSIDNITVSLLDEKGRVKKQASRQLFLMDDDAQKLDSIPYVTDKNPERSERLTPFFLPEQQDLLSVPRDESRPFTKADRAKMTQKELKENFPEAIVPKKGEKIPYAIVKSPLYRAHKTEAARVEAFAERLKDLYNEHKNDPDAEMGRRWYEDFIPLLRERYGDDAQVMAELLAATSPNNTPKINFMFAERAFERWKAGEFDNLIKGYEEGMDLLANGELLKRYEAAVPASQRPAKVSPATLMGWWVEFNDLIPRQRTRVVKGEEVSPLFGMHSRAVLKVITRRWMEENAGPKTDNFVRNLLGTSEEATIDLWAARTMREAGYGDSGKRWRIMPENAMGVSDADFAFSQKAFRKAAEDLGMKPRELQGALWFIEKKRWAERGWAELDLGDYSVELRRAMEKENEGGVLPDPQRSLFDE